MGNKKETKLIVLCIVLLVTCFGAYSKSTPKSISQRVPLKQSLGPVRSFQTFEDIILEPHMIVMLDLDDHIFRNYKGPGGNVNLYIGYYLTTDKAYASHSPLACFPSQGWKISDPIKQKLTAGDQTIHYAELTASIQEQNELILYWYQAGDKTTSSVTRNKYNALYNKIMHKPEEHAFIRVTVPISDSGKEAAENTAHRFIKEFYPEFSRIIGSVPQVVPPRGS